MIYAPAWLLPAYLFNIVLLVPVCYQMFAGRGVATVFEGKVAESPGLRLMIACIWLAILLASFVALRWPAFFAPMMIIQIVYKAMWLIVFVMPLIITQKPWPQGIAISFAIIVVTYPVLLLLAMRSA